MTLDFNFKVNDIRCANGYIVTSETYQKLEPRDKPCPQCREPLFQQVRFALATTKLLQLNLIKAFNEIIKNIDPHHPMTKEILEFFKDVKTGLSQGGDTFVTENRHHANQLIEVLMNIVKEASNKSEEVNDGTQEVKEYLRVLHNGNVEYIGTDSNPVIIDQRTGEVIESNSGCLLIRKEEVDITEVQELIRDLFKIKKIKAEFEKVINK